MTIVIEDIKEIAEYYDNFIIDIWGVIFDGQQLYEGTLETIRLLNKLNKKIIFLTNAPRRSTIIIEALKNHQITTNMYEAVITSGEVTYYLLKKNQFHLEAPCYKHIGPQQDRNLLEETEFQSVETYKKADFILVTGFDDNTSNLDEQMAEIKHLNIPMICTNPDVKVTKIDGTISLCAGAISQEYQKLNKDVTSIGKPYPEVYDYLLDKCNIQDLENTIAIGDNLSTDIKGANNCTIDSLLIASGLHKNKLIDKEDSTISTSELETLCTKYQAKPNYVTKLFGSI